MKKDLYKHCDIIHKTICNQFNIPEDGSLFNKTRQREVVYPRQLFFKLCTDFTDLTFEQLSRYGKNRFNKTPLNHATVIHARKVVQDLVDTNGQKKVEYVYLYGILENIRGGANWQTYGRKNQKRSYWGNPYFDLENISIA